MLPGAYVLDDAPAYERFSFITSATHPIAVDDVLAGVKSWSDDGETTRALRLPRRERRFSVVLRKRNGGL